MLECANIFNLRSLHCSLKMVCGELFLTYSLNMSNAVVLMETLVSTIARAFYTDTVVVLLEGLMHEKYIIEEELGPRLKLSAKEIRKITTQLESEMLVRYENVTVDDTKSFLKCYYIDYQQFVDSVRFRMHLMQKEIISEEKSELNEVFFECPTCKTKFTSLEVQRLRCVDYKFVCNGCCPNDFRTTPSETFYRLIEIDNTKKLTTLQLLEKKLEEQMNKSKLHDSIYEILSQLREIPLSHNLPSYNISKGIKTSEITDERVVEEIKQNLEYATGQFGSSLIKKKTKDVLSTGIKNPDQIEYNINIETEDSKHGTNNNTYNSNAQISRQAGYSVGSEGAGRQQGTLAELSTSLPHFLRDSRVTGAKEMLDSVHSLKQTEKEGEGENEQVHKRAKLNEDNSNTTATGTTATTTSTGAASEAAAVQEDEDADDVAWEGGEEEEDVAWED